MRATTALAFGGALAFGLSAATCEEPERIPHAGVPGTKHERTFIAIKPDGVHRHLVGDVVKRFEQKGYKLVGLKMLTPTIDQAREHYGDLSARPFFPALCAYFSSGPIVAMVWEGHGVIKGGRRLLGTTNPDDSPPGSIRGDFCIQTGRNIIHGSDGPDSARAEITFWFKDGELNTWTPADGSWVHEK